MKRFAALLLTSTMALMIILSGLALLDVRPTPASTQAAVRGGRGYGVGACGANRIVHQTTNEYRMAYDGNYRSAQRIAAATEQYRMAHDPQYRAARQMIAASNEYRMFYDGSPYPEC
jgi:hypothetical protein